MNNPFEVLGLKGLATPDEIRSAYRSLARKCHPDMITDPAEKEAARIDRSVEVLLQLHVAQEETKSGFSVDEVLEAAESGQLTENLPHVRVCGVMAMASLTDDMEQVAREFDLVRRTYLTLKDGAFDESEDFNHLSMGMSDDWQVAVKYGATLVRIGTAIFGSRNY